MSHERHKKHEILPWFLCLLCPLWLIYVFPMPHAFALPRPRPNPIKRSIFPPILLDYPNLRHPRPADAVRASISWRTSVSMSNIADFDQNGPDKPKLYHCGTLTYTKRTLLLLSFWLLWGDICYTLMEAVTGPIMQLKF